MMKFQLPRGTFTTTSYEKVSLTAQCSTHLSFSHVTDTKLLLLTFYIAICAHLFTVAIISHLQLYFCDDSKLPWVVAVMVHNSGPILQVLA